MESWRVKEQLEAVLAAGVRKLSKLVTPRREPRHSQTATGSTDGRPMLPLWVIRTNG